MTETITSPQNEKLKLVRRLAERRGREREGMFVTEGEDLLAAGTAAGRRPELVLVAAGHPVPAEVEACGVEAIAVEPRLIDRVSTLGSGTRALAIWRSGEPGVGGRRPCVYLDGVADPGNVGAIVRSAAALGAGELVLGPGSADPYAPKAVRASMGAIFGLPPRGGSVATTPRPRLGLVAHGADPLERALADCSPATVCLGSEREGLGEAALAACERRATIPLGSATESLNVAATAAIALYRICSGAAAGEANP